MREREGAFRLLPGPKHVVFMRYTGEDGRRDSEDGAVVRLAGEITAPGAICDIVAFAAQTGWRGELVVHEDDTVRNIFFDQGNVVGVATSVESERIGSILYKFGAIDAAQRDQAIEESKRGKRFGEALLGLGHLTQEQLYQFMSKQVDEVVFAALSAADGTFFFLDGFDDSRLVSRHTVAAGALLMDGVTRMDEMRFFRRKIPSADHVPAKGGKAGGPPEELATIFEAIDGQQSIEEIGRSTGLGEFETTRQVYTLLQSQHVVMHPPRVSGGPRAIVSAANAALEEIFRVAAASHMDQEVRANLASFAVGAGVYDILLRNAGPDQHGMLDVDTVVENSALVAAEADPVQVLRQMLHEYVSFGLFSAGAGLGSQAEAELVKSVAPMLGVLKPQG